MHVNTKFCWEYIWNWQFSSFTAVTRQDWPQANTPLIIETSDLQTQIWTRWTTISGRSIGKVLDWQLQSHTANRLWSAATTSTRTHHQGMVANLTELLTACVDATSSICSTSSVRLQICILILSPTSLLFSEPPTDYRGRQRSERWEMGASWFKTAQFCQFQT